jgi:hypothetical protein
MNFRRTLCCLVTSLAFQANADTFSLADGSTLQGTILSEDETSYVLEVQVTKSIKDERVVAKADVVKIQREKKDLTAFEPIAKLVPTPDALTAEQYASRISAVEKFLKEHRGSAKSKEARAILATLKAEANEVQAGGIKIKGKMLAASDYRANALDIDAGLQEAQIREFLAKGAYVAALRAFSGFDREFKNANAHAALKPLILQAISSYLAQIEQTLAGYETRLKERETGLQRMNLDARRNTQSALAEEAAAIEARFKAEKDAKLGWVTTDPYFKPSLEETLTFGKQETTRLSAIAPTPLGGDAGKAYREALQKILNAANAAAATAALTEAKNAMVSAKYLAILQAAASAPR